jgi:NAD(P)-dependent dehydrogenase (short-subunit alcohol dehydrogenase family)
MSEKWTARDIPDQAGRTAVVTGANSGLGEVVARELARAGATVILACRDTTKGEGVARSIEAESPGAALSVEELDLASLASVREAARRISSGNQGVDLLVNNAGVMASPRRQTGDGFEMHFGVSYPAAT